MISRAFIGRTHEYLLDKASKKPLLGQLVMGRKVFFFSPRVVKIKYKHTCAENTHSIYR